ncbi:MAG: FAD-dependent oxidoreductase [Tepidanaerobacteraceae bacterium]
MQNSAQMQKCNITSQWARKEASRCLFCFDAPCKKDCPAEINVPLFIRLIRWGDIVGAKKVIKGSNILGGICAYLCPSEELCQKNCNCGQLGEPIQISDLQCYACNNADFKYEIKSEPTNKKVAVIGAGPAGLSCAMKLKSFGHSVDIYEKEDCLGGTVAREIPPERIPQEVLQRDIEELNLTNNKVRTYFNMKVDKAFFEKLIDTYDAVFISTGLDKEREMDLINKSYDSVYYSSDFLTRVKKGLINKVDGTFITIGGGNTAIDCARTALELGAERSIIAYRRSKKEMPAYEREFIEASVEGIEFMFLVSPKDIRRKGKGIEIEFCRNKLVPGKGKRKSFTVVDGTEFTLSVDMAVFAVGMDADVFNELIGEENIKINPENLQIGNTKVFSGGDCVNENKTVVQAVADGKKAALGIDKFLKEGMLNA